MQAVSNYHIVVNANHERNDDHTEADTYGKEILLLQQQKVLYIRSNHKNPNNQSSNNLSKLIHTFKNWSNFPDCQRA